MKQFSNLRDDTLLEKLKSSDPTGKWIRDFVHSDNPKFAGKSKKERIRMALGASYAAKRNEDTDLMDEAKDSGEYDYEGEMAMTQLRTIIRHSEHLLGMLSPNTNLPEWVQSKITLATDYLQTSHDYMMSKDGLDEVSSELLDRYKEKANKSADTLSSQGKYKQSNDRRLNVMKATGKQIEKTTSNIRKSLRNENVEVVAEDMKSAAAELSKYASAHGGIDKDDFHTAAKHMEAGNNTALHNHINNLDSEPRDKILTTLHKHGNDIKRYGYATEEVEPKRSSPDVPFDGPYSKKKVAIPGKAGYGFSAARHLAKHAMKKIADKQPVPQVKEGENTQMKGEDPCEPNYQMIGTKKKGGKEVPNCVPAKK